MITYVANIINVFALSIQHSLNLASFIGQLLIAVSVGTFSTFLQVFKHICLFFQIVYEDNISIFTEDIPTLINSVSYAFINYLQNDIINCLFYEQVYSCVCGIIGSLKWLTSAVFVIVFEVVTILKNGVVYLGCTCWSVITFIPVHIPKVIKIFTDYFNNIVISVIKEIYNTLLNFTNFLTDVPLQSLGGIISVVVLIRLYVHFNELINISATSLYWLIARKSLYIYHTILNYFNNSDMRVIAEMASGDEVRARSDSVNYNDDETETLCVVCQERQKCVLTLPCRHVCLCIECCMRLYGYQRTCPICRTFIYYSVTVYL